MLPRGITSALGLKFRIYSKISKYIKITLIPRRYYIPEEQLVKSHHLIHLDDGSRVYIKPEEDIDITGIPRIPLKHSGLEKAKNDINEVSALYKVLSRKGVIKDEKSILRLSNKREEYLEAMQNFEQELFLLSSTKRKTRKLSRFIEDQMGKTAQS